MEHYLNDADRRTQTYCEKNLWNGQFVHHKSHTDLPGIESRPPRWQPDHRPSCHQLRLKVANKLTVQQCIREALNENLMTAILLCCFPWSLKRPFSQKRPDQLSLLPVTNNLMSKSISKHINDTQTQWLNISNPGLHHSFPMSSVAV